MLGGGGMEILPAEVWLSGSLNITLSAHEKVQEAISLGKGHAGLLGCAGSGLMEQCGVSPRHLKLGVVTP